MKNDFIVSYIRGDKLLLKDSGRTSKCYDMYLLGTFERESVVGHQFIAIVEKFNQHYPIGTRYESTWLYTEIIKPYSELTKLEKVIYEA